MNERSSSKLVAGDRRTLARCITLIESRHDGDRLRARSLLEEVMPRTGRSLRIGITGAPGVGKSTFIDVFGMYLVNNGKKVAVLTIDPSSPFRGGSILGDKTRMGNLSRQQDAFIRPSPASDNLGGVAHKTREAILLCEAAGFDIVLVETVGVGQSESDVAGMVDMFLVLVQPNSGDELQGIKRGIIEHADLILVNKADGGLIADAELARSEYHSALMLLSGSGEWKPRVQTCSALHQTDIDRVWASATEFFDVARSSGEFSKKRADQNAAWFRALLQEQLERRLASNQAVAAALPQIERSVIAGEITPFMAVTRIDELLR